MSAVGSEILDFATEIFPICRSITGDGLRQTLRAVQARIPLRIHEVPSGSKVFDWEVPPEWNIEGATLRGPDGRTVVDFRNLNLHVLGYSEPVDVRLDLEELKRHLYFHPHNADWIPHRTSYYTRRWGFCLPGRQFEGLPRGQYRAFISSRLEPGSLSYGECRLRGRSRDEFLLFTHACHPSLANDNASGVALAMRIGAWLAQSPRRYTYRIIFAPSTIGSLCWLKRNERDLGRIRHGLVLGLLGDAAPLTYKESRRGKAEIDAIARQVLAEYEPQSRTIPFEPFGYDERQLCSPGFDLPVGRLTRSVNGGYPEYHSSADNLSLISAAALGRSFEACQRIILAAEENRRFVSLSPKGEPRLGKRGLYGATTGQPPSQRELAMLWVLNQSDGSQALLEIAAKSGLPFETIRSAAAELEGARLLRAKGSPRTRRASGAGAKRSRRRSLKR